MSTTPSIYKNESRLKKDTQQKLQKSSKFILIISCDKHDLFDRVFGCSYMK